MLEFVVLLHLYFPISSRLSSLCFLSLSFSASLFLSLYLSSGLIGALLFVW